MVEADRLLLLDILNDMRRTILDASPEEVPEHIAVEIEKMHREARVLVLRNAPSPTGQPEERERERLARLWPQIAGYFKGRIEEAQRDHAPASGPPPCALVAPHELRNALLYIESLRASLTRVEEERDLDAARARLFELFQYYFVSSGTPFSHVANVIVHDPKFLQAMGLSRATSAEVKTDV